MSVCVAPHTPLSHTVCGCLLRRHANKCAIVGHMKLINMQAKSRRARKKAVGSPKPGQLLALHLSKSQS